MYSLLRKSIILFIIIFSHTCSAWWSTGHEIVAKIAYDRLQPEAKIQVDKLTEILRRDYPELTTFTKIAPWPDSLRAQKIEAFTHWHYIDNKFSTDNTPITNIIDSDNAVWALTQIMRVVKNNNANPIERARFLAFVVHIVGDLHQPLHNAARVTSVHPLGDQGGNLFFVKDPNASSKLINLHSLWDSDFGAFDSSATPDINNLATIITTEFPEAHFGNRLTDLSISNWSQEGLNIAKTIVYDTPENLLPNANYLKKGKVTVEEQIALAGYRLAAILNLLFVPNVKS